MKKIIIIIMVVIAFFSCNYLDIVPDNVATIENAFTDAISAERFLATVYWRLPYAGRPTRDQAILAGDEFVVTEQPVFDALYYAGYRIKTGQQNTNSPLINNWEGTNQGRDMYDALRECNIFLENINNVPDLSEEKRNRWIAEIKFLKAYYHYYLLRLYGPVPLVKENLPISASIKEVQVYREPFDDCVSYIVSLLDEARPDLPLSITAVATELGRITRPMAASLKADVLVTAASPLFNGNSDYKFLEDNRGIKLFSQDQDAGKWERAATACKEAIDVCESANTKLFEFTDTRYKLSDETRLTMTIRGAATELWNQELIWAYPSTSMTTSVSDGVNVLNSNSTACLQVWTLPYLSQDQVTSQKLETCLGPTFETVEMFYSKNGIPIDEDIYYDYANRYQVTTVGDGQPYYVKPGFRTAILNIDREPRFYGNLGFDGGYWFGNGRTKDVGQGSDNETAWLIRAKRGETSGKLTNIRHSRSGYFCKKGSHYNTEATSTNIVVTEFAYPVMRLADLYLLYAEALNETLAVPNNEVYEYIDKVRSRAGLKGVVESWTKYSKIPQKHTTQSGMREIIHRERLIELAFEGKRFYDLRRWKKMQIYHNRNDRGWNIDSADENYYTPMVLDHLTYTTKQYLWPISEAELRRNSNLVQNPYW